MARRYGGCPCCQRLVSKRIVGTLEVHDIRRCAGCVGAEIAAPCVCSTDRWMGRCFRAYVEQFVVLILRQGDIVVMDNLPSHKSRRHPRRPSRPPLAPSCATCPRTAQTSTRSNSLNSKPCCERSPPEPSKRSSQQSPRPSPKSVRKSGEKTTFANQGYRRQLCESGFSSTVDVGSAAVRGRSG